MSAGVVGALRRARALIEKPERWTRRAFAMDAKRQRRDAMSHDAVCFCMVGAVLRVCSHTSGAIDDDRFRAATCALEAVTGKSLFDFNDHLENTHADILALFDRAIAAEESES